MIRKLNPGKVKCLGCDKLFNSIDKSTNRICPECTRRNNKERLPRMAPSKIQLDGRTISLDSDD